MLKQLISALYQPWTKPQTSEKQLAFEAARYKYCVEEFEREAKRQENLEKKSQFYLSFVTLFLGAIFLNIDFLTALRSQFSKGTSSPLVVALMYITPVLLALSLAAALISVLVSMGLRDYKAPTPRDLAHSLFEPNIDFLKEEDSAHLYKATGLSYAIALEHNRQINEKKAEWVKIASYCIFASLFTLCTFLANVVYLFLI